MTTIYFDKQIFSYLFKSKEDKHRNLLQKIIENRKGSATHYSFADPNLFTIIHSLANVVSFIIANAVPKFATCHLPLTILKILQVGIKSQNAQKDNTF